MSIETAQKAIDYFLEHNSNLANIIIGFYGGEPLLEFELIKKCVAYAKSRVEGKNILFNMTTNGTLLTDEMVDFLVENDFSLSISIDGSKEEHDRNRKFVNGKGSFDVIINNIKNIRGKYPEFEKNIQIMTTVNPYIDLGCVLEYFSTEEIFSDKSIMFNSMNENNLKEASTYDQKYYRIRNYEYIKMLFNLVGKLDKKYVSDLVHRSGEAIMHLSDGIGERSNLMEIMHHNGPCLPGVRKLFIRTDGKYYPCERVNEMQEYFCIGSINEGINVSKAKSLLNIGKLTEDLCKNCWAIRHCSMCAAQIEFNENLTYDDKVKKCNEMKQRALFNLQELCVLKEFGMANDNIRSLI